MKKDLHTQLISMSHTLENILHSQTMPVSVGKEIARSIASLQRADAKLKSIDKTSRQKANRADGSSEQFNKLANELISNNIDNHDYNINKFADDMCIGRTIFYRRFKELMNTTPNEFILARRLGAAAKAIQRDKDITIAEIADNCGFSSPQYFSSCFKRHYGITPIKFSHIKREKLTREKE